MACFAPVDDPADGRIADYTDLRGKDPRDFLVAEGAFVIRQLLGSRYRVRSLLVTERGRRGLEDDLDGINVPVYVVAQPVMAAICGYDFHRGALATADRMPLPSLPDLLGTIDGPATAFGPRRPATAFGPRRPATAFGPRRPATAFGPRRPVLVVEGVNDQENLGALFRNAAAFGTGAVVLDPTSTDPLSRRCVRVSMGQALRVPFTRVGEWPAELATLREHGYEVVALTPSATAEPIQDVEARPRRALLVGAEGPGLSSSAMAAADRCVRVPLAPGVDSLNVATAAAIALHRLAPPG